MSTAATKTVDVDVREEDVNEEEEEEVFEEELDPRVQEELEKLNAFTEEINQLELQLEDANCTFRNLLTDSTHHLKSMSKRLGNCIEKARPYYVALELYHRAQQECQSAATHYQRASGIHMAAKETIALAEQRFLSNSTSWDFDNAWQEMLNHATIKVMEAEKQKTESEAQHLQKAASFQHAEDEVKGLEKKLGKMVQKSQPYFEQKDVFNKALSSQKVLVLSLQEKVVRRKSLYAQSLRNLEDISESIHARRKLQLTKRLPGVGAETMTETELTSSLRSLPSFDLDHCCDGASSSGGCGTRTDSSVSSFRQDSIEGGEEDEEDDKYSHRRQESDQGIVFDLEDHLDGGGSMCRKEGEGGEGEGEDEGDGDEKSLSGMIMKKLRISWKMNRSKSAEEAKVVADIKDLKTSNDVVKRRKSVPILPEKDNETVPHAEEDGGDDENVLAKSVNLSDKVDDAVLVNENYDDDDNTVDGMQEVEGRRSEII